MHESLSAIRDGEVSAIPRAATDAHVSGCARCRAFALDLLGAELVASTTPPAAPDPVGVAARLRAATAGDDGGLRALVLGGAVGEAVLAGRQLAAIGDPLVADHAARHLGAFSAVVAAMFFLVAATPRRATPMLPAIALLLASLSLTSIIDIATGVIPAAAETAHLPAMIGGGSVVALHRSTRRRAGEARAGVGEVIEPDGRRPRHLHAVPDDERRTSTR